MQGGKDAPRGIYRALRLAPQNRGLTERPEQIAFWQARQNQPRPAEPYSTSPGRSHPTEPVVCLPFPLATPRIPWDLATITMAQSSFRRAALSLAPWGGGYGTRANPAQRRWGEEGKQAWRGILPGINEISGGKGSFGVIAKPVVYINTLPGPDTGPRVKRVGAASERARVNGEQLILVLS